MFDTIGDLPQHDFFSASSTEAICVQVAAVPTRISNSLYCICTGASKCAATETGSPEALTSEISAKQTSCSALAIRRFFQFKIMDSLTYYADRCDAVSHGALTLFVLSFTAFFQNYFC